MVGIYVHIGLPFAILILTVHKLGSTLVGTGDGHSRFATSRPMKDSYANCPFIAPDDQKLRNRHGGRCSHGQLRCLLMAPRSQQEETAAQHKQSEEK